MPNVFTKNGFRFFFYSNEHLPIHVHARKGEGEAVFEVEGRIVLREAVGMKPKDLKDAEDLAEEHQEVIIRKWHEYFG